MISGNLIVLVMVVKWVNIFCWLGLLYGGIIIRV